jgi:hypothetical protein
VTGICLNNIVVCLTPAVTLLKELNHSFDSSFVQPIANTIETLINVLQLIGPGGRHSKKLSYIIPQNVKQNKKECAQLMEHIHQVLYAIINLYFKSETVGSLLPTLLDNVNNFIA